MAAIEQLERGTLARQCLWKTHAEDDFIGGKHCGHGREKKLRARDFTPAAAADHGNAGRQSDRDQGQLRGRIGVRQAAAERAALTDGVVANGLGRLGQQGAVSLHQLGFGDLVMPG